MMETVSLMVYCNLKNIIDGRAEYAIGSNINNITGTMIVNKNGIDF